MAKITANLKERLKTISSYLDGGTFTLKNIGINPKNQEDISAVLDPSKGKKLTAKQQKDIDKIRAINLEENQIEHPGFLQKILGARPKISAINLRQNPINAQGFSSFAEFLKTNTSLKTVAFSTYGIKDESALNKGLETIFAPEEGEGNTTLTRLEINQGKGSKLPINNKSKIRIETLTHCAPGMKHLRILVLSNCIYRPKSNENLNNFIHGKYQKLTKDEANVLAGALKTMQLEWLSLSNNAIGDVGIKIIAEKLLEGIETVERSELNNQNPLRQKLQPLRVLYLDNIKITYTGLSHIVKSLANNTSLQRLHLNNNTIGDEGIKILANSLVGSNLSVLELCNNKITDQGVQHLAGALKSNPNLTEVDLRGNKGITIKGANTLHKALKNNTTITRLDLTNPYRKGSTKHKTMQGIIGKITDHLNTNKGENAEKEKMYLELLAQERIEVQKELKATKAYAKAQTKEFVEFKKELREGFDTYKTSLKEELNEELEAIQEGVKNGIDKLELLYVNGEKKRLQGNIEKTKLSLESEKLNLQSAKATKQDKIVTSREQLVEEWQKILEKEEKELKHVEFYYYQLYAHDLAMRPPSAETNTEKHIEYREDALSSLEIELSKKKEYLEVTSKTKKQELDERLTNKKEKNKQKQKASKDRVAKAEEEAKKAKTAAQTAATILQQATTAATAAEEKATQLTEALKEIEKSQESEIEKATKALNDFITKYNEEHPKETPKSFPDTYIRLQQQLKAADAAKKRIEEEKGKGKTIKGEIWNRVKNKGKLSEEYKNKQPLLEAQLKEKEREIELLNNLQTAQKPIEDQKALIQIQTKKTKDKDPAQEALTIANRKQALAEQKLAKTKETEKAVQKVLEHQLQKEVDLHKSIEAEQKEKKEEKEKEKKRIEKEIRTVEKHLKAAKVANNNNKIVVVEGKIRELEKLEEEKKEALKEIIRERFKIAPKDVLNPSATNSEPEKIFKPLLQKAPKKLRTTLLEVATDIASELTSTSSTLIQPEAKKPSSKDTPVNDANTKKTTQQIRAKEIAKKPKSFLSSLKKLTRELSTTYNTLEDYKTTLGIAKTFDADKKIDNDQNLEARRKEREAFYNDPSNRANATYQNELQEHLLNALHQANIITSDVVEIKEERSAKAVCSFLELIGEEAPVPGAKTVTKFISAVIKCVSENRVKRKAKKINAVLSAEADVKDIVRALGYLLSKIHEKPDTYFKTGLAKEHAEIILNAISKETVSRQKLEDPTFRHFALHLAEIIEGKNILKEQDESTKHKKKNGFSKLVRTGTTYLSKKIKRKKKESLTKTSSHYSESSEELAIIEDAYTKTEINDKASLNNYNLGDFQEVQNPAESQISKHPLASLFKQQLESGKCCLKGSFESEDLELGLQDGDLLLTVGGDEYDYELNLTEEGLSLIIKEETYELQLSVTKGIVIAESVDQEDITINTEILNPEEEELIEETQSTSSSSRRRLQA